MGEGKVSCNRSDGLSKQPGQEARKWVERKALDAAQLQIALDVSLCQASPHLSQSLL